MLGKQITASQIQASQASSRKEALQELVIGPVIGDYLAAHSKEVELTPQETKTLVDALMASAQCQDAGMPKMNAEVATMFAQMMGGNAKAQRFIYLNHGRGRVLFQQGGMEALDATHRLILELEKRGKFTIHNPEDRTLALSYWATQNHGAYLQADPGPEAAFQLKDLVDGC